MLPKASVVLDRLLDLFNDNTLKPPAPAESRGGLLEPCSLNRESRGPLHRSQTKRRFHVCNVRQPRENARVDTLQILRVAKHDMNQIISGAGQEVARHHLGNTRDGTLKFVEKPTGPAHPG